jgi:hypothetical protein
MHPEAIVRTLPTGGITTQRCIFEGDKPTVISEFCYSTREILKCILKRRPYSSYDEAVSYRSRVSTLLLNHSKHIDVHFYVSE